MQNRFDVSTMLWLNSWAGHSENFDKAVALIAHNTTIKSLPFVAVLFAYWFRDTDAQTRRRTRERLVCSLCASIVAVVLARALALLLPFRVRPELEPLLHFRVPGTAVTAGDFIDWSSFPSDHAVLFTALAVGIGMISLRVGFAAVLYFIVFTAFPRVYMGYHYPTDMLVGMTLGAVVGYLMNTVRTERALAAPALRWEAASPGSFYVVLFLINFQIATLFNALQELALSAVRFVGRVI